MENLKKGLIQIKELIQFEIGKRYIKQGDQLELFKNVLDYAFKIGELQWLNISVSRFLQFCRGENVTVGRPTLELLKNYLEDMQCL